MSSSGYIKLIAIGASTGGVEALVKVISGFPRDCPPTVITQHMPAMFTASFANRLNGLAEPQCAEAEHGAPLERGRVYVAPGGVAHLEVDWSRRRCILADTAPVNRHRPAVDVMFDSVARQMGRGVVAVLLTGMGRDGAEGMRNLRAAGARTIAQDQSTSTVFGMPRAAIEIGAADFGTPLPRIAQTIFNPETSREEAI